ncbi:unnamed protein product, partial [Lymnaea stagnalis]
MIGESRTDDDPCEDSFRITDQTVSARHLPSKPAHFKMKRIICLLVIYVGLINGREKAPAVPPCDRVVCYVTLNGMRRPGVGGFRPDKIPPKFCTHIIIGHMTIVKSELKANMKADHDIFKEMLRLKVLEPLLDVIVSVEANKQISELVEDDERRLKFVASVVKYLREMELDGLNLALVNPNIIPEEPEEKLKYSYLMRDLQESFQEEAERTGRDKLLLVADVSGNDMKSDQGYEVFAFSRYLDFINILTLNYHGNWDKYPGHNSPIFADDGYSIDETLRYWVQRGMTRSQINAAIPTYGRSYHVTEPENSQPYISGTGIGGPVTKSVGFLSFFELCKVVKDEGEFFISTIEKSAIYKYEGLWITYDNVATIRYKVQFYRERGYGGIVIYTLDFDDIYGTECHVGEFPLTKAAAEAC